MPTSHGMNVFWCVCPSDSFAGGSPSLGLFSPSQRQKVSNPKNGAVHLPAPAHRHVDTVCMSDPCCIGLPIEPMQLNSTAVTAFDCLKNTLPTTHCGVLKVITTIALSLVVVSISLLNFGNQYVAIVSPSQRNSHCRQQAENNTPRSHNNSYVSPDTVQAMQAVERSSRNFPKHESSHCGPL